MRAEAPAQPTLFAGARLNRGSTGCPTVVMSSSSSSSGFNQETNVTQ
jgi:hypothetical protein